MECVVIRNRKDNRGRVIGASYEPMELSPIAAENLSEIAVVVSLGSPGSLSTVYENRESRQADLNVNDLRELAYSGPHMECHEHLNWY